MRTEAGIGGGGPDPGGTKVAGDARPPFHTELATHSWVPAASLCTGGHLRRPTETPTACSRPWVTVMGPRRPGSPANLDGGWADGTEAVKGEQSRWPPQLCKIHDKEDVSIVGLEREPSKRSHGHLLSCPCLSSGSQAQRGRPPPPPQPRPGALRPPRGGAVAPVAQGLRPVLKGSDGCRPAPCPPAGAGTPVLPCWGAPGLGAGRGGPPEQPAPRVLRAQAPPQLGPVSADGEFWSEATSRRVQLRGRTVRHTRPGLWGKAEQPRGSRQVTRETCDTKPLPGATSIFHSRTDT